VYVEEIPLAYFVPKLSQCLNEWHTLYIADCSTLANGELKAEKQRGDSLGECLSPLSL
jgi:hypothetical protein